MPFILLASLLAACSDDHSDEQSESQTTEQTETAGESSEQANEEASEDTNVLAEGQYEDQLDVDILEATDFLEGTGFSDEAPYSESIEAIEGTLAPEEEITGDILFVAHEADEYFIRVREGLIGSGAAKNQIRFTIQASEIDGS
ncbi:hypothetical protein [Alkalicoccobacillus gibsonii]|uniref:hypothetical protein n=1 Tax=Alkalicoccobacillus gibsonii TaxID=79881 RepID=UPI0035188AAC